MAIRNVQVDDEHRKKPMRIVWVECDENGRPIKTGYVPKRCDVLADDDDTKLPWKTYYYTFNDNLKHSH